MKISNNLRVIDQIDVIFNSLLLGSKAILHYKKVGINIWNVVAG